MGLRQMEPTIERIGTKKFYITPFSAFKAANLTGELASVLAPLLGTLAPLVGESSSKGESSQKDAGLMDIDAGKAVAAMSGCGSISGDKLEVLMKRLLLGDNIVVEAPDEDGNVRHERLDRELADELFCGEVHEMFLLCFYVIRLNFNCFFKKLTALSGKGKVGEEEAPEAKTAAMIRRIL